MSSRCEWKEKEKKILDGSARKEEQEIEEKENQKLEDYGQMTLEGNLEKAENPSSFHYRGGGGT